MKIKRFFKYFAIPYICISFFGYATQTMLKQDQVLITSSFLPNQKIELNRDKNDPNSFILSGKMKKVKVNNTIPYKIFGVNAVETEVEFTKKFKVMIKDKELQRKIDNTKEIKVYNLHDIMIPNENNSILYDDMGFSASTSYYRSNWYQELKNISCPNDVFFYYIEVWNQDKRLSTEKLHIYIPTSKGYNNNHFLTFPVCNLNEKEVKHNFILKTIQLPFTVIADAVTLPVQVCVVMYYVIGMSNF